MFLPPSVAEEFPELKAIDSDDKLFESLVNHPAEMLKLFEVVTEFDSWCEHHASFIQKSLNWFTRKYFVDELSLEYAARVASAVQNHYSTLESYLLTDLTLVFKDKKITMNSLMLAVASPFFRQRIADECRARQTTRLHVDDCLLEDFYPIEEYALTGNTWKLWRKSDESLLKTLELAQKWDIPGIVTAIQDSLGRYIDNSTMYLFLKLAIDKNWPVLKQECIEYINNLGYRVVLKDKGTGTLAFEFLSFSDEALRVFENLKDKVTHLIASGVLTEDPNFRMALESCPFLIGVDIAHSGVYTENLKYLPSTITELDISKCGWLNANNLKELIQTCPRITHLNICSNSQLNYNAWQLLQKIGDLKWLDVSQSHWMNNEDFKIILKASRYVIHLNLEHCDKISEEAFFEIGRSLYKLESLNVARTNISDSSLIQIAVGCKELTSLNISGCRNLSRKGIQETLKEAPQIKKLVQ